MSYDQDHIDDYLLGRLTDPERLVFEEALTQNPELVREVEEKRLLIEGIEAQALRNRIRTLREQERGRPRFFWFRNARTWAAAAVILLLIAAYWLWPRAGTPQDLFAEYYQPYPVSFATRSGESTAPLVRAGQLYYDGRYQEAATLLESLEDTTGNTDQIRLALGISYLEIEKWEGCEAVLLPLSERPRATLSGQSTWYLALAYLKQDAPDQARPLLKRLASTPQGDRQLAARALLRKLE